MAGQERSLKLLGLKDQPVNIPLMPRIPHRQPLPIQAADIILEMISSGDIQDLLPGERSLASQLQIGRDTLRAALEILEADGIISSREHGKRRRILSSATRKSRATKRIAFLSPKTLVQLPPWMLVEFDTLRELLNQRGYVLQLVTPGLFHLKNPARKLESLIKDIEADAWILHQCTPPVQEWFDAQKIPALIRGYPQPDIQIPFIDEDWEAAAFHAGTLLKRNGHRRVGLLIPDTHLAGLRATEVGLRKAFPEAEGLDPIVSMIEKALLKVSPVYSQERSDCKSPPLQLSPLDQDRPSPSFPGWHRKTSASQKIFRSSPSLPSLGMSISSPGPPTTFPIPPFSLERFSATSFPSPKERRPARLKNFSSPITCPD